MMDWLRAKIYTATPPIEKPEGLTIKAKILIYWVATTLIALETFAGRVTDLIRGRTNHLSRRKRGTSKVIALGIFQAPRIASTYTG
jgi:hypothetical protein